LATEQLDLFDGGEDGPAVVSVMEDGIGRVLYSKGGGWRARYTGSRYGWQFDRLTATPELHRYWTGRRRSELMWEIADVWEQWEPDLPYGMEHVHDRELAESLVVALSDRHGDDPRWLIDYAAAALDEEHRVHWLTGR
jgi:hypothetical protein